MKTLPLLLIAGAGYFVLNKNKKLSVSKTISDKDKGFTQSDDCKNFIVTDYDKAMKWAFSKGKLISKFDKDSGDKLFKCSGKNLTPSKENLIFFYNLMIEFSKGYLSVILESLASDSLKKCKEFDLEERFEYLAYYNFLKVHNDAGLLGNPKEINDSLATWLFDSQKSNIDIKGLPTKL